MSIPEVMPVFRVLRLVRDARSTKNADRELLYALVLRCNPAKKFIAWPSYRQLALDTCLDKVTLKRAAKRLEEAKLIKRVVRANRSNCFFVNVALLQDQAAEVKAAEAEAKKLETDDESPFEQPMVSEDYQGDEGGVA
jgi:DNA-binding MarR family transcriptional regulator